MDETTYHRISEEVLNGLQNVLEEADQRGDIEVEREGDILSIACPGGRQLLVSKHAASRQLWLSSPVSGGLHFRCEHSGWLLPDGRTLQNVLQQELKQLAHIDVRFV